MDKNRLKEIAFEKVTRAKLEHIPVEIVEENEEEIQEMNEEGNGDLNEQDIEGLIL